MVGDMYLESYETNSKLRIPATVGNVQVNFCKNPACPNFGVPASQDKQPIESRC